MGTFRSQAALSQDQATLTSEDRPRAVYEDREVNGEMKPVLVRPEVPEDQWLSPGETITYWTRMPHGAAADIADAATTAEVAEPARGRRQARMRAVYHPGRAAVATFLLGIVDWTLRDENDKPVPFERPSLDDPHWFAKGKRLMSGLPAPLVNELQERIGSGEPPALDGLPEDAANDLDTVGNVSGAN